MDRISAIWPEQPPDNRLQVFIRVPIDLSPVLLQTSDASTRDLWPAVTLTTNSRQTFERLGTVEENMMLKLLGSEPDDFINFRAEQAQCRWIESDTEVSFF
jgi:hypothetical protein